MKNLIFISVTAILLFTTCKLIYPLPDVKLKPKQLCGKEICDPGNVGRLLHLTKSPFSPAVNSATTVEEIVTQVLGKTSSEKSIRQSKDFSTCSDLSSNPFTSADIENVRFPDGRVIDYKWSKDLEINVEAAADANVKKLMKMTTDAAKIDKLRAKIETAYNKIKGKNLTVVGKYSEWELAQDAREKLKKGDGFQSCRKWIEDNNQRIVTAVGLVYFDISYEETSLDELAAEIDAELAKEGLDGSISFSFKREVTKRLKADQEVYQILIIRHAGINGKSFVSEYSN